VFVSCLVSCIVQLGYPRLFDELHCNHLDVLLLIICMHMVWIHQTALLLAASGGHAAVIRALVEAGCNVSCKDNQLAKVCSIRTVAAVSWIHTLFCS